MVTYKGILINGARIDGKLKLSYARISFPLYFRKSAFPGGINLNHSEISVLFLIGTHTGPIYGSGLKVEGSVFLRHGFKAQGEVRLPGATIGGDLYCDGGQFVNKEKDALVADGLKVQGDVCLCEGFKAEGKVRLVGARIGGQLNCINGRFINANGYALNANGVKVERDVFLCKGFHAKGALGLACATIAGNFFWTDVNSPEDVTLDLRLATVGTLVDDTNSWPDEGKLFLQGLVYNEIAGPLPRDANTRIDWLRQQSGFWPQPYEQLAEVFRKSGQDEDAKKILI